MRLKFLLPVPRAIADVGAGCAIVVDVCDFNLSSINLILIAGGFVSSRKVPVAAVLAIVVLDELSVALIPTGDVTLERVSLGDEASGAIAEMSDTEKASLIQF
jgi:hypothetical protein